MIEEETEILRTTWRKVRATAVKRVCWHCFMETRPFGPKWSNRKLTA